MKNLSEYIEKAKNTSVPEFPFNDGEIGAIISGTLTKQKKKITILNKWGVVIMSIIGITIFSIISFQFIYNNGNSSDNGNPIKHHAFEIPGSNILSKQPKDILTADNIATDEDTSSSGIQKSSPGDEEYSVEISDEPENLTGVQKLKNYLREKRDARFDIHPINVSKINKTKFNLSGGKEKLTIVSEFEYDKNSHEYSELKKAGYPVKGIYRKEFNIDIKNNVRESILIYNGWEMKKDSVTNPVLIATCSKIGTKLTDFKNISINSKTLSDSIGFEYLTEELTRLSEFFLKSVVETIYSYPFEFEPSVTLEVSTVSYPLARYFCPFIKITTNKKDTVITLLWYPINDYMLENIDSSNTELLRKNGRKVPEKIIGSYYQTMKKSVENVNNDEKKINCIEKLFLNTEELDKIGIKINGTICNLNYESLFDLRAVPDEIKNEIKPYVYNIADDYLLLKEKLTIDTFDIQMEPVTNSGWSCSEFSKTAPVLISGKGYKLKYGTRPVYFESVSDFSPLLDSGKKYYRYGYWNGEEYKPSISRLLPVHFTVGDSSNGKKNFNEYDVWFLVTKEFADLLPDRYRIPIKKELNIIDDVENGKIDIEDACNAIKGETSYFGLCSFSGQYIKNFTISPNPASDKIRVDFAIIRESQISISLFSYTGAFISTLKTGNFKAGTYNEEFLLTGLKEGVYLIVISDNTGDKVVRNFIIRK